MHALGHSSENKPWNNSKQSQNNAEHKPPHNIGNQHQNKSNKKELSGIEHILVIIIGCLVLIGVVLAVIVCKRSCDKIRKELLPHDQESNLDLSTSVSNAGE